MAFIGSFIPWRKINKFVAERFKRVHQFVDNIYLQFVLKHHIEIFLIEHHIEINDILWVERYELYGKKLMCKIEMA